MSKRIVLSGYFGFKNFGDEAILSLLVNKLQQDKHRITVISSNPEYTKKQFKHIRSVFTFNLSDIFAFIAKSDILISGGGSLLQDVTSLKSLFYYLLIIFFGLFLRKKVIIFAQGIGPINNPFGLFLTKMLLKHCDYVSVRDKNSFELMRKWGIKADLVPDPVFSLPTFDSEKEDITAIQIRDFKTFTPDFIERLANEIIHNFRNKKIEIYSFQDSIDLKVCKELERNIKMLDENTNVTIYSGINNEEIVNQISKAKYVIAMRFHAVIVGLISGASVLAINYDTKVKKISEEFNLPILELDEPFSNQFELLKNQNIKRNLELVKSKKFNWDNFNKIVNI